MPFRMSPGCGCCLGPCNECDPAVGSIDFTIPTPATISATNCTPANIAGTYTLAAGYVSDPCQFFGSFTPEPTDCGPTSGSDILQVLVRIDPVAILGGDVLVSLTIGDGAGLQSALNKVFTASSSVPTGWDTGTAGSDCATTFDILNNNSINLAHGDQSNGPFDPYGDYTWSSGQTWTINPN